jgi:exopolysaccharide biosynthesis protein
MDRMPSDPPHPTWQLPDGRPTPPPGSRATGEGRRPRWSARRRAAAAALAAVTLLSVGVPAGWALDRFVIDHVAIADVSAYEAALTAGSTADTAATTDTVPATDAPSIGIDTVVTGSGADTVTYYVADVVLGEATQLRSAFAQDAFGTNIVEATSQIAADNGALFAINGDYYGFRDTGIVIRNGVVYRDEGAREGLAFYTDGTMAVYDETTTSADQLLADGVWNTLSFGPALLADGQVLSGIDEIEIDTNFGNHSIQGQQPRTALGMVSANHFVLVVVDGRSPGYSRGVTMTEMAQIMADLGCSVAYNLDGGGSSTMYYDGALVNNPLGRGEERGTSDILYIRPSS